MRRGSGPRRPTVGRHGIRTRRRRDERGALTVLMVVLALCLITMISGVTDVSASYLRREAASSLADGASLAASDAAAAATVYRRSDDQFVVIDQDAAGDAVADYLRRVDAYAAYPGLHATVAVNGHTVSVDLTMPYRLPIHVPGIESSITIHVSSSAEMPLY